MPSVPLRHPGLTYRSDSSAPAPQQAYPPPSNAIAAQARGPNPYAQQNVSAAPGPGNFNQYGTAPNTSYAVTGTDGSNRNAPPQQGYGANAGNPYAQQQYGQQDQSATGANGANGAAGGVGGNDFWAERSSTNSALSTLQEEIQAVRTAHQQSLVRGSSKQP